MAFLGRYRLGAYLPLVMHSNELRALRVHYKIEMLQTIQGQHANTSKGLLICFLYMLHIYLAYDSHTCQQLPQG